MEACTMLNPYGLPLGHPALCPCETCLEVRQSWANRQPALADCLPMTDAEDTTERQLEQKEISR